MARTCISTITPFNIASKEASISAVITDVAVHSDAITVSVPLATLDTTPQKTAAADEIWAKYQAIISKNETVETFVTALQDTLNANIEARE
jgi:hypothetical protein